MHLLPALITTLTILNQTDNRPDLHDSTVTRIKIKAVGDIMMGSTYPVPILPERPESIFNNVASFLADADLTIGNLEGNILEGGMTLKKKSKYTYAFRMPKKYANILKDAGFDLLSLANNHINDFGLYGLNSTMAMLDMAGIQYSGPIGKIAHLTVKGIKIAFIAFGFSPNCYSIFDIKKAQQEVAALKRDSAVVIVYFHGGSEGSRAVRTRNENEIFAGEMRGNVVKFARGVIDSGADLVIGSGPHVLRGMEIYRERLIAYSLGNFCTYGQFNLNNECGISIILEIELVRDGKFLIGRIWPVYQEKPGIPKFDSLGQSIELIKRLSSLDFSLSCPKIEDNGTIYSEWGSAPH